MAIETRGRIWRITRRCDWWDFEVDERACELGLIPHVDMRF